MYDDERENDQHCQRKGTPPEVALHLLVRLACEVAGDGEPGCPDAAAEGVPERERAVRQLRHPSGRRDKSTQQSGEAAEEHCRGAASAQEGLARAPALVADDLA